MLKDYGFLKNNDGFLGNAFRMTVERTMYSKRTLLMKMLSFITDLHSRYVCSPFMIITGRWMNTFWFTVHRLFALPRCIVQFDLLPSPPCLSLLAVYSPPSGGAERDDSPPPRAPDLTCCFGYNWSTRRFDYNFCKGFIVEFIERRLIRV